MPLQEKTLGHLLDLYMQVKSLVPSSQARYALSVRNLAKFMRPEDPEPRRVLLTEIDLTTLAAFKQEMIRRASGITYNTERTHLSALFNFGVRIRCLPENHLKTVGRAPVPKLIPKAIPRPQITAYLELLTTCTKSDRQGNLVDQFPPQWFWLAVVSTFYYTGMRLRQLVGLDWADLDFKNETIRLRADTSKTHREWFIPIPKPLLPHLKELQARTVEIRGENISAFQVFCLPLFSQWKNNFATDRMRGDNVDAFFQRLHRFIDRQRDDLARMSAHKLRHSTATILANKVSNLKIVQELLGHTSIKTTYWYVHVDVADMRAATALL